MPAATPVFAVAAQYVLWFFVYSFAGWVFEELYTLVKLGKIVNRGFVAGPVLPIYGAGALMAVVLLRPIANPFAQFAVGCVAAAVMEYATSWVLEKVFHARWWDYADMPLNLNGRICLPGVLLFGLMMLCVNLLVQPVLERATAALPADVVSFAAMALLVLFAVDVAVTVVRLQNLTDRLAMLQTRVGEMASGLADSAAENRELFAAWVHDLLPRRRVPGHLEHRVLRNPFFTSVRDGDALEWLRANADELRSRGGEADKKGAETEPGGTEPEQSAAEKPVPAPEREAGPAGRAPKDR